MTMESKQQSVYSIRIADEDRKSLCEIAEAQNIRPSALARKIIQEYVRGFSEQTRPDQTGPDQRRIPA
jgi:predicted transcriptional regulator